MIVCLAAVIGINGAYAFYPGLDWNPQVLFWSLAYLLFATGIVYEVQRRN